MERAIESAKRIPDATVLLSTDYHPSELPEEYHDLVFTRPTSLAGDTTPMLRVLADMGHKLSWDERDIVVLFQPTSIPKVGEASREDWVTVPLVGWNGTPVVSAWRVPERWHPWYCMDPMAPHCPPARRQALPIRYRPNGLFYIMGGDVAKRSILWGSLPQFAECDCYNIDTWEDWLEADRAYRNV